LIVVFGTVCVDHVLRVPRLAAPGAYVEIHSESRLLGGEGANTAHALLCWGVEVQLFGNALGADRDAKDLKSMLCAHGLSNLNQAESANPTPVCDIYVTPDGQRTMYGRGFSSMEQGQNLDGLPLRAGDLFTAEPNMFDLSRRAAVEAYNAGMRVYLMDFIREDDPVRPGSYWQSSTDWVGTPGDSAGNLLEVQRRIDRYGAFSILTDGSNGLIAGSLESQARAYPGFPAPKTVDSTGAGDIFRAGMLYGLDRAWEPARCLAFASAAGALACGTSGATEIVPTIQEIEGLIESNPEAAKAFK
jgi:sugar/nucleoside kinase (ribokinase family)